MIFPKMDWPEIWCRLGLRKVLEEMDEVPDQEEKDE